jgi:hypothetical protein
MAKKNPETGADICECAPCTDKNFPPQRMVLYCPECGVKHIDEKDEATGIDWATRPHKKHLCLTCGFIWQPSLINTVGVDSIGG